jgi:hypothetical protein
VVKLDADFTKVIVEGGSVDFTGTAGVSLNRVGGGQRPGHRHVVRGREKRRGIVPRRQQAGAVR